MFTGTISMPNCLIKLNYQCCCAIDCLFSPCPGYPDYEIKLTSRTGHCQCGTLLSSSFFSASGLGVDLLLPFSASIRDQHRLFQKVNLPKCSQWLANPLFVRLKSHLGVSSRLGLRSCRHLLPRVSHHGLEFDRTERSEIYHAARPTRLPAHLSRC